MIVLAKTTAVLPIMAMVPMHSGLLIGSMFGRLPEPAFRLAYHMIITLTALRLAYVALVNADM
jgi:hypothetical protein